jgi:hypothetical protein
MLSSEALESMAPAAWHSVQTWHPPRKHGSLHASIEADNGFARLAIQFLSPDASRTT